MTIFQKKPLGDWLGLRSFAFFALQCFASMSGEEWFEELALYAEGLMHHSTLTARAFSEVLTLENEEQNLWKVKQFGWVDEQVDLWCLKISSA